MYDFVFSLLDIEETHLMHPIVIFIQNTLFEVLWS